MVYILDSGLKYTRPEDLVVGTPLDSGLQVAQQYPTKELTYKLEGGDQAFLLKLQRAGEDHKAVVHEGQVAERFKGHPICLHAALDFSPTRLAGLDGIMREFEKGYSLDRHTKPGSSPLTLNLLFYIGAQVGTTLLMVHDEGYVHCDVSPGNVLLASRGILLGDFGYCMTAEQLKDEEVKKLLFGNPGYISPEHWSGESPTSDSDTYALGVLVYEGVTQTNPFEHPVVREARKKHLEFEVPRLSTVRSDVPPKVDDIIAKALKKNPAERPSMEELVAVLKAH